MIAAPLAGSVNTSMSELFEFDEQLFWRLRPSIAIRNPSSWGDVTNSSGFRMTREVGIAPPGSERVVCLGDSCTYGFGVPVADAWPSQIDKRPDLDVVNAGVPGYTSFQGLRWARRVADRVSAGVAVVSFGNNDAMSWPSDDGDRVLFLSDRDRDGQLRLRLVARTSRLLAMFESALTRPRAVVLDTVPETGFAALPPRVPLDEYADNLRRIHGTFPRSIALIWARRCELDSGFVDLIPAARSMAYGLAARHVAEQLGVPVVRVADVIRASGG